MRIVYVDASAGMAGKPFDDAVAHARAFETPDTPAFVAYGPDDVEETRVGRLPTTRDAEHRMRGGGGIAVALSDASRNEATTSIVYADVDGIREVEEADGRLVIRLIDADDQAPARIAARLPDATVLHVPDPRLWEGVHVTDLVQALTYAIEEARHQSDGFRQATQRNLSHALEHSDAVMRACAMGDAAKTSLDLLRTIGTRTGQGDRRSDFGDIRRIVRDMLGGAIEKASSTSSSPTTNLMRQAEVQAAWRMNEMFDVVMDQRRRG